MLFVLVGEIALVVHPWQIEMLGGFCLSREGQAITRFRSRKAAMLVAYLAYYPSAPHPRERLVALLWPDDDPEAARNRLRVGLNSVRHQLEPPGVPAGSVLEADRLSISLRPQAFSTDVAAFEDRFTEALQCDDEARVSLLTDAVALYRGDLLPDFYEEWVLTERQRLRHSFQLAQRRLVRSLVTARDYETALVYADRAVQNDSLNEEAHRDLMRLHTALGRPAAALQQYEELKRLLASTVQASPSAPTQQLAAQISQRAGRITPTVTGSAESPSKIGPLPTASASDSEVPPTTEASVLPVRPAGPFLPSPLTRFFGREPELERITDLLTPSPSGNRVQARLVTLTGIGGAGKTRLAVETAHRLRDAYAGRVWFVPLAELQEPALLAQAILASLRLPHVRSMGAFGQIVAALEGERSLLVMDNLEHLSEPAAELTAHLLECLPLLNCLMTSRRTLGIAGEQEFPISPLPIPLPPERRPSDPENAPRPEVALPRDWRKQRTVAYNRARDAHEAYAGSPAVSGSSRPSHELLVHALSSIPSVQLFVDRAQATLPDFQLTAHNARDISALCAALEGIPLAIELAAARARVLTPGQIVASLERRDELLVNRRAGKDDRHRSLRSAIEWSLLLLGPELRRLFATLSVFRGGWTLESAEAVCVDSDVLDALDQLRTDSLILAEENADEMRFHMLETLRQFASTLLTGDAVESTRARHASYMRAFVECAARELTGPAQGAWLDRIEREMDNIRAAFAYYRQDSQGAEGGLALVRHLWRFWSARGTLTEARMLVEGALSHPGAQASGSPYINGLNVAGAVEAAMDNFDSARSFYRRAIDSSRQQRYPHGLAMGLGNAGTVEIRIGEYVRAVAFLEESLELHRKLENRVMIATALGHLALAADKLEDAAKAKALYAESFEMHRELGDRLQMATVLGNLGMLAEREGDLAAAERLHGESLEINHSLGNQSGIAICRGNLGILASRRGEYPLARAHFLDALEVFRELRQPRSAALALGNLGSLEECEGNLEEARALHEENLAIQRGLNVREGMVFALMSLGRVCAGLGDFESARASLTECLRICHDSDLKIGVAGVLEGFAGLGLALGHAEDAARLFGTADCLREASNAPLLSQQRDNLVGLMRAALGDRGFDAAFAAGRALPLDEAVALADGLYRSD